MNKFISLGYALPSDLHREKEQAYPGEYAGLNADSSFPSLSEQATKVDIICLGGRKFKGSYAGVKSFYKL